VVQTRDLYRIRADNVRRGIVNVVWEDEGALLPQRGAAAATVEDVEMRKEDARLE
jgi:hypothetical protein